MKREERSCTNVVSYSRKDAVWKVAKYRSSEKREILCGQFVWIKQIQKGGGGKKLCQVLMYHCWNNNHTDQMQGD